ALLNDHRDGDRSDRRGAEPITRMAFGAVTSDWLPTRDLPSWPGPCAHLKGRRDDCSRPSADADDLRNRKCEDHPLHKQGEESRYACYVAREAGLSKWSIEVSPSHRSAAGARRRGSVRPICSGW